jgi:hypothetical protein
VPIGNESSDVHSGGVIGQHSPKFGMPALISAGMMFVPKKENEPTTATTFCDTA